MEGNADMLTKKGTKVHTNKLSVEKTAFQNLTKTESDQNILIGSQESIQD